MDVIFLTLCLSDNLFISLAIVDSPLLSIRIVLSAFKESWILFLRTVNEL